MWSDFFTYAENEEKETSRGQIALTERKFVNAVKWIIPPDIVEAVFTSTDKPTQAQSFAYV